MSSFGRVYRVTTWGESHCAGVGCVLDGLPAGFLLSRDDIQQQLSRRRPGQSSLTTPRQEADEVEVLSGLQDGVTLGTPVALLVRNTDIRPQDYKDMTEVPRPGHADFTYVAKYGINSKSGGGRASARETIGRVAAGAVARKYLKDKLGVEIVAWVESIGPISLPSELQWAGLSEEMVDTLGSFAMYPHEGRNYYRDSVGNWLDDQGQRTGAVPTSGEGSTILMRCPDPTTAIQMAELVQAVKAAKDSIGGIVRCVVRNVPAGLGEPCFDKLPALLAHAMLSIPATKGFEFGSGFEGTKMRGSQHNDPFVMTEKGLQPATNHAGGTLGGISTGAEITFRVAFKPVSTIGLPQETASFSGEKLVLEAKGRHDPCVVPRAPVIVESMAAMVLLDAHLMQLTRHS